MLYLLYGFDGKIYDSLSMANDAFGGGMEGFLFSIKGDAYWDIYGLPFSLYGICIASNCISFIALAYGVMSQTYILTMLVQYRLLGIMM